MESCANNELTQDGKSIKLSKEEARFVEELITQNDTLLRNILRISLRKWYTLLADECLGEIYLLTCQKAAMLMKHANPTGWLVLVAKYKSIDLMRNFFAKAHTSVDDFDNYSIGDVCYSEAIYNIWIQDDAIGKLLSSLTKNEAIVYKAIFVDLTDIDDIAKELGVTRKAVLNTKSKIRKKLKTIIYNSL